MTVLDIVRYRTYALEHKLWMHVALCDRSLGSEVSLAALQHLGERTGGTLKNLPHDVARKRLIELLALNRDEEISDPAEQRIILALQTMSEEYSPPPGWEDRVIARLSRWHRFRTWCRRVLRRRSLT